MNSSAVKSNQDCSKARARAIAWLAARDLHSRGSRSADDRIPAPRPPESSRHNQRYRSSAFSTRALPAMDTSTGAIPMRPRKKKAKAELSLGSASLPSRMQANLTDLNGLLEMPDKDQSDLTINATEEAGPTKATTIGENCDAQSAHSNKPLVEDCEVATSTAFDPRRSMGGGDQAERIEKPQPEGPTGTGVLDIVRNMRQVLKKEGPSQERDLVVAVSPTHAKLMLEMHVTMTAFMDSRPGFIVVHEDLYSFEYYEDPHGEVQGGSSSHIKDEAIAGPFSTGSHKGGRHDAAACDGGANRECATIPSGRPARESAFERKHLEEKHVLKDSGIPVPSPLQSRALTNVKAGSGKAPTNSNRRVQMPTGYHTYVHKGQQKSPAIKDLKHTDAKATFAMRSNRSPLFHGNGHLRARTIYHLVKGPRTSPGRHQPNIFPSHLRMLTNGPRDGMLKYGPRIEIYVV
ncbi:hypothetical protein HPB50_014848 [Hyalomma asiaticum]|uniref:Uncharacterized protein n=1 Tax=Hyalomma asiaticum TaxID=266040 RepID=A0ACB7RQ30_HYAAI|nr:hypothetical protein HPB50_014848 [Hyalomma asiaticum]